MKITWKKNYSKINRSGIEEEDNVRFPNHKKKIHPIVKVLFIICTVILFLSTALFSTFCILRVIGKNNLYNKEGNKAPELLSQDMTTIAELVDIEWQDDWVRYDGKIYDYNEKILTFLVMGVDQRAKEKDSKDQTNGGQSDALFMLVLNPDEESIKVVAVNRDTITDIDVCSIDGTYVNTVKAQVALQHAYGSGYEDSAQKTQEAVANLFYGLPIHGYVAVNMKAIATINDSIGGVEVEVLEDLTKRDKSLIQGQTVFLQGDVAYDYVQYRDTTIPESNLGRLARQKQYLTNFVLKAKEATKEDMTLPVQVYKDLSKYMTTDITVSDLTYLASTALDYSFDISKIYTLQGKTLQGNVYEEFYPDEDALYELILEVFYQEVEL